MRNVNTTAAIAFNFAYDNLSCPHEMLTKASGGPKTTPAIAASVEMHPWLINQHCELRESNRTSTHNLMVGEGTALAETDNNLKCWNARAWSQLGHRPWSY